MALTVNYDSERIYSLCNIFLFRTDVAVRRVLATSGLCIHDIYSGRI